MPIPNNAHLLAWGAAYARFWVHPDPDTYAADLSVRGYIMRFDQLLQRGTRASQPAATAVPNGTLYCVTDEGNALEQSNGTSWNAYAPSSGGTPGGSDKNVQYNNAGAFGGVSNNATATKKYLQQVSAGSPTFEQVSGADLVSGSVGPTQLEATAVSAGTYGDSTNVAQITVDADGRITAASNVAISGGGGGQPDLYLVNNARYAVSQGSKSNNAGSFTVGSQWIVAVNLTLKQVQFYYSGSTSKTIRFKIWDNGENGSGTTELYSEDFSVSATGLYTWTLATPQALTAGKLYMMSTWQTDGGNYQHNTVSAPNNGSALGPFMCISHAKFAAGNACPTGTGSTERYMIGPYVVAQNP